MNRSAGCWLMRHGAVSGHWQRCLLGRLDVPLSAEGERQIRRATRALWQDAPGHALPTRVLISPLWRCRRSAELLREEAARLSGRLLPCQVVAELTEIALGSWDGLPRQAVRQRFPQQWADRGRDMAHYAPPGGESFAAVARRVVPVLRALADSRAPVDDIPLLLCHAGVIRALLAHVMALPLEHVLCLSVPYAARIWLPWAALPSC